MGLSAHNLYINNVLITEILSIRGWLHLTFEYSEHSKSFDNFMQSGSCQKQVMKSMSWSRIHGDIT